MFHCCIIIRKAFGVAGGANHKPGSNHLRASWPSGDWGSLPIEGGIEVAYKAELEESKDYDAHLAKIKDRLNRLRSPYRSAEFLKSRKSLIQAKPGLTYATGPNLLGSLLSGTTTIFLSTLKQEFFEDPTNSFIGFYAGLTSANTTCKKATSFREIDIVYSNPGYKLPCEVTYQKSESSEIKYFGEPKTNLVIARNKRKTLLKNLRA